MKINHKYFIVTLSLLTVVAFNTNAQQLEVIGSAGTVSESSGGTIAYTIGEMVIETGETAGGILTQGFHQSFITITAIDELPSDFSLKLYPNPATDFVIVESDQLTRFDQIALYDMAGQLVWKANGSSAVDNRLTINFENRAAGNYIVRLSDSKAQQSFSYSLIKSH